MTIQQKCAERIYELLPHKRELEFGCELEDGGNFPIICINSNTFIYKGNSEMLDTQDVLDWIELRDIEIIGQPIRLADVLMAIGKDELELLFNDDVLVVSRIVSMYNLEKDNILDQSDEFCELLLDLIK